MTKNLAPLKVGDRVPCGEMTETWDGKPIHPTLRFAVVTEVLGDGSYAVSYPDGTTGVLTDSE